MTELGVCGGGAVGGAAGLGDDGVEGLVELIDVDYLDPLLAGGDEDGGGVAETDALAEGVVVVDLAGELAGGIHDEGHGAAVGLEVLLGEGLEVVLAADGDLVGEDGAAEVLGGPRRDLVLDIAGGDGGVEAPEVHAEGEVVAHEGDLVVLDGGVDDGKGVGAGGALEIFELVDGDPGAGGRLDGRGVFEGVTLAGGNGLLRGGGERDEERGGGEEEVSEGGLHRGRTHRRLLRILAERQADGAPGLQEVAEVLDGGAEGRRRVGSVGEVRGFPTRLGRASFRNPGALVAL